MRYWQTTSTVPGWYPGGTPGSPGWTRWTRWSVSTSRRSGAPRGPTRPPTPGSSTTSAGCSRRPPRPRSAGTGRGGSRSTSRAAGARSAPATTLSGGEAQRVKLASELQKRSTGRTVYVLDEPTTGLHFEDIRKLLKVLDGLVDKGNTVIVIEHNLDVIKTADWLIDMGPAGGHRGGQIVAAGTPEELAEVPESFTGDFLRGPLGLTGAAKGGPAAVARADRA